MLVGGWAVVAAVQSVLWVSVRFKLCMEQKCPFGLRNYLTTSSATGPEQGRLKRHT